MPRSLARLLFAVAVVLAGTALAPLRAQTVARSEYSTTTILAEQDAVAPGGRLWFAFRQTLEPGWHVFWINPGDAGLPLRLDWTLPDGFSAGEVIHPIPDYIPVGPLASYAHEGAPVFLVAIDAPADAAPGDVLDVAVHAQWQVCEEICVPEEAAFSFPVAIAAAPDAIAENAPLFDMARARLPETYQGDATVSVVGEVYRLSLSDAAGLAAADAFFFAAPEGLVEPAAGQRIAADGDRLTIDLQPGWREGYDNDALAGVLAWTGADGARRGLAIEAAVATPLVKPQPAPLPQARQRGNVAVLLLMAFFGGVILNVMPCVFPIIFVKAASFMASAREHPGVVRAHGALFGAGTITTFLLLGAVLLGLRAGGAQIGWGFHLQSPVVIALSTYVLFMVGLNLVGAYTVGAGLMGAGQNLANRGGALGAFFTGALAVVVAAPCIGPLLSAPMGAALLLPPLAGLGVFLTLGAGFAAPYFILSMFPRLGARLPRPGAWMETMRQLMAFPVFAAAAYFLWVLSRQATAGGFGTALAGVLFLAFGAWCYERSKDQSLRALVLRGLASLALIAAIAPLFRIEAAPERSGPMIIRHGAFDAEAYTPAALNAYRAKGVPVFLEFTAAWCVTCQFDKATVFSDQRLADAFADEGVVFMIADWTTPDPAVTEALQSFGAGGVPLYVYYPPAGAPVIAPTPISRDIVRRMLAGEGSGAG